MILPSFITNGSFLEILRQNSWILGVFDSSYQGLLLEGPELGWFYSSLLQNEQVSIAILNIEES